MGAVTAHSMKKNCDCIGVAPKMTVMYWIVQNCRPVELKYMEHITNIVLMYTGLLISTQISLKSGVEPCLFGLMLREIADLTEIMSETFSFVI